MNTRPPIPVIDLPVLTPEQDAAHNDIKAHKTAITKARRTLQVSERALREAKKNCTHVIAPGSVAKSNWSWWGGQWNFCSGAYCAICEKDFGWYCLVSPKHYCEYNREEDPMCDSCIHCGMPDERK